MLSLNQKTISVLKIHHFGGKYCAYYKSRPTVIEVRTVQCEDIVLTLGIRVLQYHQVYPVPISNEYECTVRVRKIFSDDINIFN